MSLSGRTVVAPPPPVVEAAQRVRTLITPEGVDLRLRLGDASERAGAFLIDVAAIVGTLVVFTIVVSVAGRGMGKAAQEAVSIIWLLGFFVLRNAYFILFELSPRAATPGKRVMGLRVAARDGGRLTAGAIFARNALRDLEIFVPLSMLAGASAAGDQVGGWLYLLGITWTGIFLFFPLFNRDRLRAGDLVAGTWVVKVPRERLSIDLAEGGEINRAHYAFTPAQAGAYGVKELHVLEEVLRRRDPRTLKAVAARIRAKIGWIEAADETDSAFLSAYYVGLRERLETRLLFGHRRKDKFDTA